jgi:hypothetical protein
MVAAASAKPTAYSRARPRFEPQVPEETALGWLVLKKVVPATLVELDTTFSPVLMVIFQL